MNLAQIGFNKLSNDLAVRDSIIATITAENAAMKKESVAKDDIIATIKKESAAMKKEISALRQRLGLN